MMQTFVEQLLERARRQGFSAAEAYILTSDSFDVSVLGGKLHEYRVSGEMGLGFRGLYEGKMGYASTQVLDEEALEQLTEGAKANAQLVESGDDRFLWSGAGEKTPDRDVAPQDPTGAREKIDLALALERMTLSQDSRVARVEDCGVFSGASHVRIVNTLGLDRQETQCGCGMYVSAIASQDGDDTTGGDFLYGQRFDALDAAALARTAVEKATARLHAGPIPSGRYRVLLRNDAAAALLHTFFGVFSADAAQKGFSLLKGREGELIASQRLTIREDPWLPGGYNNRLFDGEGVLCREKEIVREGRLETLLHNLKTAAKQGVATTGNASRGSYGSSIGISATNVFIAPGVDAPQELMRRADRGLLVTGLMGMHAGANPISGDFSLGVQGFVLQDGVPGRPVKGVTIAGNIFSLLKDVQSVGNDLRFGYPGGVSIGSPTLDVGEMMVAGNG